MTITKFIFTEILLLVNELTKFLVCYKLRCYSNLCECFEILSEKSVPAFVIFSDATLIDMSRRKPTTKDGFPEVSGVGEVKYKRYGEAFMEAIRKFK